MSDIAIGPKQKYYIAVIAVALRGDMEIEQLADEMSAMFSESGVCSVDSPILDWGYASEEAMMCFESPYPIEETEFMNALSVKVKPAKHPTIKYVKEEK